MLSLRYFFNTNITSGYVGCLCAFAVVTFFYLLYVPETIFYLDYFEGRKSLVKM